MAALAHRRLRAPTEDGAALIDPSPRHFGDEIKQNRSHWLDDTHPRYGLTNLRISAREHLYSLARSYTGGYRSIPPAVTDISAAPFILSGHQPELFHPGVWFKNFLLSESAKRVDGIAINLVIDNDVLKQPSIAVPTSGGTTPVEFDRASEAMPLEERPVVDELCFASFRKRVEQNLVVVTPPDYRPFVNELWPSATDSQQLLRPRPVPNLLGQRLAQSRHIAEERLGLETYEVPLSAVCQSVHFRSFAARLLTEHARFLEIHNRTLAEYRAINRLRSHTHPVPDLEQDTEYAEMPFWLWTRENPLRHRVFARRRGNQIELTDRKQINLTFNVATEGAQGNFLDQLAAAEARGIKLRPRALVTTMYARLVLSDLFIHGIGGAKYDELTDLIIRRFFGIEPPAYVTATATFRLPIERPDVSLDEVRQSAQRIREIRYRPESFLNELAVKQDANTSAKLNALAEEKRAYLFQHDLRRCSIDVFKHLDILNRAMHDLLQPVEQELRAQHAELISLARQSQLLGSREFSFVLFPAEKLSARLLDLSKTIT
jgi:hypothetical protein